MVYHFTGLSQMAIYTFYRVPNAYEDPDGIRRHIRKGVTRAGDLVYFVRLQLDSAYESQCDRLDKRMRENDGHRGTRRVRFRKV